MCRYSHTSMGGVQIGTTLERNNPAKLQPHVPTDTARNLSDRYT